MQDRKQEKPKKLEKEMCQTLLNIEAEQFKIWTSSQGADEKYETNPFSFVDIELQPIESNINNIKSPRQTIVL